MADIRDTAADLFGKGKEAFDDLASSAGEVYERGVAAVGDIADVAGDIASKGKIKLQLFDAGLEFDSLMKKLGEAVYEQVKDDPNYAEANQELFEKIAAVAERKQELEDQIAAIDAAAAEARPVDVTPDEPGIVETAVQAVQDAVDQTEAE